MPLFVRSFMMKAILVGAVAYAPQVVPIWEGMRDYFREAGPPIDYILFSNYDRQVQALLDRHIDIAWNTNLAWIKVHRRTRGACRALAMRDVDARFTTVLVARTDSGIASLADLRGKRLALGSADSAQAAILPRHFLHQAGVDPERDCTAAALRSRCRQARRHRHERTGSAAPCEKAKRMSGMLAESPWNQPVAEGRIDARQLRPIWTSPGYCHCNFTALADFPEDLGDRWTKRCWPCTTTIRVGAA